MNVVTSLLGLVIVSHLSPKGSGRFISECFGSLLHAPRGPFYSPKAARSRWRPTRKAILAFCRVAHQTVRCTTGQPLFMSGAWSPSYSGADDRCRFVAVGAPDTVRCTSDSPVPPADHWRGPHVARGLCGRPLRWRPLAHRTVWCTTGQSGELYPYADKFSRERPVHRSSAWRTEHCLVHHRTVQCARLSRDLAVPSQVFWFFSFLCF
jgi:hypothetical protein